MLTRRIMRMLRKLKQGAHSRAQVQVADHAVAGHLREREPEAESGADTMRSQLARAGAPRARPGG